MRHKVPDRKALLDDSNSAFFICPSAFAIQYVDEFSCRFIRVFPYYFHAILAVIQALHFHGCIPFKMLAP